MFCQHCGQSNPDDHRFCGMCGARLEAPLRADSAWRKPVAIDDEDPLELASSEVPVYASSLEAKTGERERKALRDSSASKPADYGRAARSLRATAKDLPPDTAEEEAEEETQSRHEQPAGSGGIGGPSFLGLNYSESDSNSGFVYDTPRRDGFVYDTDAESPEYLLDEQPRRSSWRAWALFLFLVAAGALGYIQWRASHHQGPDLASILSGNGPTLPASGPVAPEKGPAPAASNSASSSNAATSATSQSGTEANHQETPASDQAEASGVNPDVNPVANPATPGNKTAASKTADNQTAGQDTGKAEAKNPAPAPTTQADSPDANSSANKAEQDAATPESDHDADATDTPPSQPAAASKPRTADDRASAPEAPKTLGDHDPLVIRAEDYLQGRGVRQNCSTAVNLLRQAVSASNPAAAVKMGALYWTGTCVPQSNVTAYLWFTRAQDLEPNNRWIARSKSSLWASMTSAERQRVGR
ncbi:MAG TPA: zinc-ribbon domain-containing protein [Terriglobales bacterium]|nr:zinc-ribbon domain-containing protein [Terriglobales bacterium]